MNDWFGNCQCARCRALDDAEGSPMGSLLYGVNKVAAAVEKEFPETLVATHAYIYARKPPKTIRPRDNVLVWLCVIERTAAQPIDLLPGVEGDAAEEPVISGEGDEGDRHPGLGAVPVHLQVAPLALLGNPEIAEPGGAEVGAVDLEPQEAGVVPVGRARLWHPDVALEVPRTAVVGLVPAGGVLEAVGDRSRAERARLVDAVVPDVRRDIAGMVTQLAQADRHRGRGGPDR